MIFPMSNIILKKYQTTMWVHKIYFIFNQIHAHNKNDSQQQVESQTSNTIVKYKLKRPQMDKNLSYPFPIVIQAVLLAYSLSLVKWLSGLLITLFPIRLPLYRIVFLKSNKIVNYFTK